MLGEKEWFRVYFSFLSKFEYVFHIRKRVAIFHVRCSVNKNDRVLYVRMTWRFLVYLTVISLTNRQNIVAGIGFRMRGEMVNVLNLRYLKDTRSV